MLVYGLRRWAENVEEATAARKKNKLAWQAGRVKCIIMVYIYTVSQKNAP